MRATRRASVRWRDGDARTRTTLNGDFFVLQYRRCRSILAAWLLAHRLLAQIRAALWRTAPLLQEPPRRDRHGGTFVRSSKSSAASRPAATVRLVSTGEPPIHGAATRETFSGARSWRFLACWGNVRLLNGVLASVSLPHARLAAAALRPALRLGGAADPGPTARRKRKHWRVGAI